MVTDILIKGNSVRPIIFNKDVTCSIVGPLLHFGNSTASCVLELLLLGCVVLDVILKLLLNNPIQMEIKQLLIRREQFEAGTSIDQLKSI